MAWFGFYSWGLCLATQDLYAQLQQGLEVRWLNQEDHEIWQEHKHSWETVLASLSDGSAWRSPSKQRSLRAKLAKQQLDAKASDCMAFRVLLGHFNSPDAWLRWQQEADDVGAVQALYDHWKHCSDVGGLGLQPLLAVSDALDALVSHLQDMETWSWWRRWWLGHGFFDTYAATAKRLLHKLVNLQSQCATYACRYLVSQSPSTAEHPMKHWVDALRRAGVCSLDWPTGVPSHVLTIGDSKKLFQMVGSSSHSKRLIAHYSDRDLVYGIWAGQWMPLPADAVPMLASWPEEIQRSVLREIDAWVWEHYDALDACGRESLHHQKGLSNNHGAWERLADLNGQHVRVQGLQQSLQQEAARQARSKHTYAPRLLSAWSHYLLQTLRDIDHVRQSCWASISTDIDDWHAYWIHCPEHMEVFLTAMSSSTFEASQNAHGLQSAEQCRVIHALLTKPSWTHDDCVYLNAFFKSHPLDTWLLGHRDRLQDEIRVRIETLSDCEHPCHDGVDVVRSLQLLVDLAYPIVDTVCLSHHWQQLLMAYLRGFGQKKIVTETGLAHLRLVQALLLAYMGDDMRADPGIRVHLQAMQADPSDPLWWSCCVQTAQSALQGLHRQWLLSGHCRMQPVIESNLESQLCANDLAVADWLPWVQRVGVVCDDPVRSSNLSDSDRAMMQRIEGNGPLMAWTRMHGIFSSFEMTWESKTLSLEDQWQQTASYMQMVEALALDHQAITWWLGALTALMPAENQPLQSTCPMRCYHDHS